MLERVNHLVEEIRKHRDVRITNVACSSIGNWYSYYEFMKIIISRYKEVNDEYIKAMENEMYLIKTKSDESGKTEMDDELLEVDQRLKDLGPRLHLEIESFYIFAKVLLDRIADTFGYYFHHKWKNRGSTHSELCFDVGKICENKKLVVHPPNIVDLIEELREKIVKYRTGEIEHPSEPRRLKGTTWGPDKKTKISSNVIYPTEKESQNIATVQKTSEDLNELLSKLENYMNAMADFLSANIQKSVMGNETNI